MSLRIRSVRTVVMNGAILDGIARVHRAWKRQVVQELVPYAITPKQLFLLRELRTRRSLSPNEIASLIYADRAATMTLLTTLEHAGWLVTRRDSNRRKGVRVELARAGAAKLESVPERLWRGDRMRLDPEGRLTAGERTTLQRLLDKLEAALDGR